jgi:hypothetical protein
MKQGISEEGGGWSKRLESVRKDSKCTFGTLKKRFRVLRLPSLCNTIDLIDATLRARCMLHNILLRHDALSTIGHRTADWQADRHERARAALDASRMDRTFCRVPDPLLPGVEREAAWSELRDALVTHFSWGRKKKEVRWLKTAAVCRPAEAAGEGEGEGEENVEGESDGDEWGVGSDA